MTTYYVCYEDPNGDNMDLFVFEVEPADVLEPWKAYYEAEATLGAVTAERPIEGDYLRIIECPYSGGQRPGAVNWDGVTQWWAAISWDD
jgi:hypothetical protein